MNDHIKNNITYMLILKIAYKVNKEEFLKLIKDWFERIPRKIR